MRQKILHVDLTKRQIKAEEISDKLRKEYLGGGGINSRLLYDSEAMYHDAMSEKNVIVFGVGCLVGNGIIAGNRMVISGKSPVTDLFGDTNVGGDFPVKLRKCGVDHIVVKGRADKPVYLLVKKDGTAEILPADHLWGTRTDVATDLLTECHGNQCEVACIGTSGENLVRFANVMISKNHAAGRMGLGCIMGTKQLKAIVVENGARKMEAADIDTFSRIRKCWLEKCKKSLTTQLGRVYGTLFLMEINMRNRHLPVNNAMQGNAEDEINVLPDMFKVKHQVKKTACYSCPVGCSKKYEVREGRFKGEKGERIEFGAAVSVGPYVGIYNWDEIIHLKLLCDYMGVDTIEMAASIGLILEAFQKGKIPEELMERRNVRFGSVDDIEYLMNKMDRREGIGYYIADGAYRAGKRLDCSEYAFCVNKSSTGLCSNKRLVRSLGYLTSTRGGDHLKSFAFTMQNGGYYIANRIFHIKKAKKQLDTTDRNGRVLWWHENYKNVVDAIGVCLFAIQGLPAMGCALYDDFADLMQSLYGVKMTPEDVLKASERIYQLQNSFNVNCGLRLEDYKWPQRQAEDSIDSEYLAGTRIECRDADGMLPEYFAYRGLRQGLPTIEKFQELGMEQDIERAGCVPAERFKPLEQILKEVNIVICYTWKDRIHTALSNSMMGYMLRKKSDSTQRKLKSQEV